MRATWGEKPGKDFMNTLESEEVGKYGRVRVWRYGRVRVWKYAGSGEVWGGWECGKIFHTPILPYPHTPILPSSHVS